MWRRFQEVARRHPSRIAISNESGAATYAALAEDAARLQQFLDPVRLPVVLIALPGGPAFTMVQLAVWGAQGVVAPIPDKSTEREASGVLDLLMPDLVVISSLAEQRDIVRGLSTPTTILTLNPSPDHECMHRIVCLADLGAHTAPLEKRQPKWRRDLPPDARLIQFTSGSTGQPKGIVLSNENLTANLDANRTHLLQFEGMHVFSPLPQFHAMGGAVVMEHLWHGSPVHLSNRFMPGDDVARLRRYECRAILAGPHYFKLMLRLGALSADKMPGLHFFTIGTAAVEPQLVSELHQAYPASVVYCRYGLSESVGALTRMGLRAGDHFTQGQVGHFVDGVECEPAWQAQVSIDKQANGGEIVVRSPCNAVGQLLATGQCVAITDECGFLHTGDVGYLDHTGGLRLQGRLTSFIKVNGYRLSSLEIEAVLKTIPGVNEAVVIATPDPVSGQRIVACLEPFPDAELPAAAELDRHCRSRLSAYKLPQRFVVFNQLPRTHAGKPNRPKILTEINR